MYDLVIRNAEVIDGTGAARRRADVAVTGFAISEIGVVDGPASVTVDGAGQVVCPGFIDVHSHDDFAAFLEPEMSCKALQGVTSEVVGNCGIGAAPWPGAEDWFQKLHPEATRPDYEDYSGYLRRLEEAGPSLNVAVLAGHGALRRAAAPHAARKLDAGESLTMQRALHEAREAGVFGLSAGLIYEPGVHADEQELSQLVHLLAGGASLLAVHLRSEADELLEAVKEALRISEKAEVGLQLSHHKAHGRNNWGKVRESLGLVTQARERGRDVWVDQYPYTAGSTVLSAVMDRGGLSSGPALGKLLATDIVVASCPAAPKFEGLHLEAIASYLQCSAEDAAAHVLDVEPGTWVVVHAMSEEDVRYVMKHEATLFGSDGLPTQGGRPHPRLYGTFPRILGHYCRDEEVLSLEQAIFKMTGASAARFALTGRGELKVGNYADMVLLDPSRIAAGSSYDEPRGEPVGISAVWVNGTRIVSDGAHTGARPGHALRYAD